MLQVIKQRLDFLEGLIWSLVKAASGSGGGPPTGPAGGSLSGTYPNPGGVVKFQGVAIASAASLAASQVYVGNSGGTAFDLRQLTQDDIAAGFTISSFTGGSTVEIGATVTNPAFTAAYSSIPDSANITNTDGIDSPLILTTPFTAGTVVGSFVKAAQATTTFTLHATKGSVNKTATSAITWNPRSFGGVGTAGASSATASGNNAVLNGGDGTLGSIALLASVVGQTFGPFTPSTQKIYLLLPHTASPHTFKDAVTGFAFAFNAPTTFAFPNQNSDAVSMDLYESTNLLNSTFSITVVT